MIYFYIIEKAVFEKTVFSFNTFNGYTLSKSDFEFSFNKNNVDYVACLCDESYISDETVFTKIFQNDLEKWLISDVLEISPRQFDLQLIDEGMYEQVKSMIDQSNLEVKIWYTRSTVIKIDNPILREFAMLLGKDIEFLKSFFKKASLK